VAGVVLGKLRALFPTKADAKIGGWKPAALIDTPEELFQQVVAKLAKSGSQCDTGGEAVELAFLTGKNLRIDSLRRQAVSNRYVTGMVPVQEQDSEDEDFTYLDYFHASAAARTGRNLFETRDLLASAVSRLKAQLKIEDFDKIDQTIFDALEEYILRGGALSNDREIGETCGALQNTVRGRRSKLCARLQGVMSHMGYSPAKRPQISRRRRRQANPGVQKAQPSMPLAEADPQDHPLDAQEPSA
jgi:DNA-directed RNA polymerase specialized sigma24 family protein